MDSQAKKNCLQITNPPLAKEWHPTKNGELTPAEVTARSKRKVWWICKKGHEWRARIFSRDNGHGCPYCSGRLATEENNLQVLYPDLAKEWHPTKNEHLKARNVKPFANRKVWWLCDKGHEWQAYIHHRTNGNPCPHCSGKRVSKDNCLETLYPHLADEWHPTKNGSLAPTDVKPKSNKKVWWICKRGHEWPARIFSRTKGTGCPYCTPQTSQIELRIYSELKHLFKNVAHRKKLHGLECDIYVKDLKLAIEIDGLYWHKDRGDIDKQKIDILKDKGINLLRVREKGLKKLSENDIIYVQQDLSFSLLKKVGKAILEQKDLQSDSKCKIERYLRKGEFENNDLFLELLHRLPSPIPELSLHKINRALADEWHPKKNGNLTPFDITPMSNLKVWWVCENGHEWKAQIALRNLGTGCPYCKGKKVGIDNSLEAVNPNLAKEWHPSKNNSLTPKDVTAGSYKKVWWVCEKGHEWEAPICDRNRKTGCPYCAGQKVGKDNSLGAINPDLARQWHPTKNGDLTPWGVTPNSNKRVWWICEKDHEWLALVHSRNKGSGCPYCSGRKASKEYNLEVVNPGLAKQWHSTKNEKLKPKNVTPHSDKRVWWICEKGHEWATSISNRSKGSKCPYCIGRRKQSKSY